MDVVFVVNRYEYHHLNNFLAASFHDRLSTELARREEMSAVKTLVSFLCWMVLVRESMGGQHDTKSRYYNFGQAEDFGALPISHKPMYRRGSLGVNPSLNSSVLLTSAMEMLSSESDFACFFMNGHYKLRSVTFGPVIGPQAKAGFWCPEK